jgi:hypothetical protein
MPGILHLLKFSLQPLVLKIETLISFFIAYHLNIFFGVFGCVGSSFSVLV